MKDPVVLITGCSSGIGRELVRQLAHQGFDVWAGARRVERLNDLKSPRVHPVELDVNDTASIDKVVAALTEGPGRLDILINNAGYGAMGPLLDMPQAELEQQFRTNVFAPVQLIQASHGLLQQSPKATVVNICSISGILATPFSGAYCATKSALATLSDVLRMELAPLGVHVMTVHPGAIESEFGHNATNSLSRTLQQDSPYAPLREQIEARAMASQKRPTPTAEFVTKLVQALNDDPPPPVIYIGNSSRSAPLLARWLPIRWRDALLKRAFKLNTLTSSHKG